ncbi:hypothetical protein FE257_004744 [Aspergillus nanangensis]|uniref:Uncharacterized protein n=1 Tax=Aspergillus nanangensis TaxID=2582783 RepID=A0AAD4CR57_ASPNN|nr:hypothetical protein FE257_004744 [Aspergillus nanangensis]
MSDDEYYDEYDDDILWIEEPDPTIADDLALTSMYDPLYVDDPSLEVQDFASDWEELSDDYYDEDPTAVRLQRVMAKWPNKVITTNTTSPVDEKTIDRVSKSKVENSRRKAAIHAKFQKSSFQSVVWKLPTDVIGVVNPNKNLHEPGYGEQVALLKNWREIFRSSHPATTEKMRIRKGASLTADVDGLNTTATRGGKRTGGDTNVDKVPGMIISNDLDAGGLDTAPIMSMPSSPVHASRVVRSPSDVPDNSKMMEHEYPIEGHESYEDPMGAVAHPPETPPKRSTRVNGTKSKKSPEKSSIAAPRGRKRKASISGEHSEGDKDGNDSKTTAASRSKRVASKKVGEAPEQPPAPSPVRRSTRNMSHK